MTDRPARRLIKSVRPPPGARRTPPATRPSSTPRRPAPPAGRAPQPAAHTVKLIVEYDGSRYRGWQEQSNAFTVQEVIKNALNELLAGEYRMAGAGRTDAGVHALGQVVSLETPRPISSAALLEGLNSRLGKDVNILKVESAPSGFHARHSAVGRSYLYQISLRRTAFAKAYCWWVKSPLDLAAIEASLPAFVGMHDYLPFADRRSDEPSTRVKVDELRMVRRGDLVLIRIRASHFLWKMVRRIVGVLVKIGSGDVPAGLSVPELGRRYAEQIPQWTAPAAGLFLECVLYPGDPPPGEPIPLITL